MIDLAVFERAEKMTREFVAQHGKPESGAMERARKYVPPGIGQAMAYRAIPEWLRRAIHDKIIAEAGAAHMRVSLEEYLEMRDRPTANLDLLGFEVDIGNGDVPDG